MAEADDRDAAHDPQLSPHDVVRLTDLLHRALRDRDDNPIQHPHPEPLIFEGRSFGRFERLTAVGVGGFGCVYRAHDPLLGRDVALKIPYRLVVVDPEALRRFRTEAEAAAAVDHPGVIPLFEVGDVDGRPYLCSAFCEGENLAQRRRRLASEGRSIDCLAAARIALALARALSAAHAKGVIHRDLKPSNVILQPVAEPGDVALFGRSYRVRIIDFGLAKLVEAGGELTRSDQRVGTPLYMAPEQISRRFGPISPRTDVYGLGATLYTLLAGREPFSSQSDVDLLAQVVSERPPSLSDVRPPVPSGLAAVCRRCLEKSAADRYPSMTACADDLERFLDGRPVRARRAWLGKTLRASTGKRALAAGVIFFSIISLAASAWRSWDRWTNDLATARRADAQRAATLAAEKNEAEYLAGLPEAFANAEAGNGAAVRAFLRRYEGRGQPCHVEAPLLRGLVDSATWAVKSDASEICSLGFSWAGIYCGLSDGRIELRDPKDGKLEQTLERHRGPVNAIVPLFGGIMVASFGQDGRACIWGERTYLPLRHVPLVREFQAHDGPITAAALAPDGRHVITGGADGVVKIWRIDAFPPKNALGVQKWGPRESPGHPYPKYLVVEPDGQFTAHQGPVRDFSFHAEGKYLVSAGQDQRLFVWEFDRRRLLAALPSPAARKNDSPTARNVFFLDGGPPFRIAAVFDHGPIVLYQLDPLSPPTILWERSFEPRLRPTSAVLGRGRRAESAPWPDGSSRALAAVELFVTREDGSVAAVPLDAPDAPIHFLGDGHEAQPQTLIGSFGGDHRVLVSGDRDGWVRMWDSLREPRRWTRNDYYEFMDADGQDGRLDAAGFVGDDFVFVDWGRHRRELFVLQGGDGFQRGAMIPDPPESLPRRAGPPLRVGAEIWRPWESEWQCNRFVGREWEIPDRWIPFSREVLEGGPLPVLVDWARGGVYLLTVDLNEAAFFPARDLISDPNGSPLSRQSDDGRWLALRTQSGLRLFQVDLDPKEIALDQSGRPTRSPAGDFAFSPGGDFLAAIFEDERSIVVWSTATGARHTTLYGRKLDLSRCAVTGDGKRVLALERASGRLNIWNAATGASLGSFAIGPPGEAVALELDPHGRRLLAYLRRQGRSFLEGGGDTLRVFTVSD